MGRTNRNSSSSTKLETVQDFADKINEDFKVLNKKMVKAHDKKGKLDQSLNTLESLSEKGSKAKLKNAYITCMKESETEAQALRDALAQIVAIRSLKNEKRILARKTVVGSKPPPPIRRGALMVMLQQAAANLPLWVGKLGEKPPPLCGAVPQDPNCNLIPGTSVAGLVKGDEDEHNWILAEVVGPVEGSTTKWELEDVDEEQKERYSLLRKKIISLPTQRANPTTHPNALFAVDSTVLALYPQTTCFYKGVVEQVPSTATEDYMVAFEDTSYATGYSPPLPVPQRYIIHFKDIPGCRPK